MRSAAVNKTGPAVFTSDRTLTESSDQDEDLGTVINADGKAKRAFLGPRSSGLFPGRNTCVIGKGAVAHPNAR
jgi:hypothetical protein